MSHKALNLRHCRICKDKNLVPILNLGKTTLANSFLKKSQLNDFEPVFPLSLRFCKTCGQLQTSHVVNPELMFRNYVWVSSTSPVTVNHFTNYAKHVYKKLNLKKGDFVVEMGSNDGVLLKPFKNLGMKILGVDPARNVARRANASGIPTIPNFFNQKVAKKIAKQYGMAKVVAGNNVFAHIHDLDEIVAGVNKILDKNGVFVIEFPYLVDFIEKNLFDIVYHEHLSYPAVLPLSSFFSKHHMQIFDAVRTPVHGGSIRLLIKNSSADHRITKSVEDLKLLEKRLKLHKEDTFIKFSEKVKTNKKDLIRMLKKLRKQNKSIVGYGAAAKSNTLLTYFGINNKILDYIVDDSPYKQGLYTPGTHIPIVDISRIKKTKPDYVFISAWNFAEPIMAKLNDFKKNGGHFIIPVPKPYII